MTHQHSPQEMAREVVKNLLMQRLPPRAASAATDEILAALASLPSSDGLRDVKCKWCNDTGWAIHNGKAREGCLQCDAHLTAALSTNPSSDAVPKDLLDRAERAWQRFFYPAADCFINDIGDKHLSVDLEVADCLRLVMGAVGHPVRTPDGDVPLSPSSDADALREALARIVKGARLSSAFGSEFRAGDGRFDHVDLDAADAILALIARSGALYEAASGIADDYMTSEHHHPGYVLIPTAKFEAIRAALQPSTDTAFSISKRRYEEKTASRSQPATGRG